MKKEFYFKTEELPPMAEFTLASVRRDVEDFTAFSPMFTTEYLAGVDGKIKKVYEVIHSADVGKQLKMATDKLATQLTNLRAPLNQLEIYFKMAQDDLDILPQDTDLKNVRKTIGLGNAEGVVKELHRLIAIIKRNQAALEAKGFTPAMLEQIETTMANIISINTEQSALTSARNINTQENTVLFNDLWRDVKLLIQTGKAIYGRSNPAKAKDYTITALRRRVNAERPK